MIVENLLSHLFGHIKSNASVYFKDPDGNSLELMCYVEVPNNLKHITDKLSFEDWEELTKSKLK